MEKKLKEIFARELKINSPILNIAKLHGDASYRTYYRAKLSDGQSFVVMQMPEGKASASEEITNYKGKSTELPFINIANYLNSHHIPVPKIYHFSRKDNILILEDLGDRLLAMEIEGCERQALISFYKRAIDLLVKIQKETRSDGPEKCVALQRSFDGALLNWEFDHFAKYGIEARLNIKIDPKDRKIFEKETMAITDEICSQTYGFTHRDFQSRNLIIHNDVLYLIDFQDALRGPSIYDLVALTRDSYITLSPEELKELLAYYCELSGKTLEALRPQYNLVTVQRKLKDAGRFVYIDRIKGNPNFLKYIPASLGYAKEALNELPKHKKLKDMIEKYIPEWK